MALEYGLDLSGSGHGPVAACYEYDSELSCSVKTEEFLQMCGN
jgi:hypothetical protein